MLRLYRSLLLLLFMGCGRETPLAQVEGTVRIQNQPAANLLITFVPDPDQGGKGPRSSAITDAEGRYRLRSDKGVDGAVVGWHRVLVEDLDVGGPIRKKGEGDDDLHGPPPRPSRTPRTHADFGSTPLKRQVERGVQQIDFQF